MKSSRLPACPIFPRHPLQPRATASFGRNTPPHFIYRTRVVGGGMHTERSMVRKMRERERHGELAESEKRETNHLSTCPCFMHACMHACILAGCVAPKNQKAVVVSSHYMTCILTRPPAYAKLKTPSGAISGSPCISCMHLLALTFLFQRDKKKPLARFVPDLCPGRVA